MAAIIDEDETLNPLISIVIPTFNRAATIIRTLNSVKSQTHHAFECLVIDDFSNDNTKSVMEQYSATDARFKYIINQKSKGAGGARNTGLHAATGKYITFLDSDDLLLADALRNRITPFLKNSALDLVIANQSQLKNGAADYLVNVVTKKEPIVRFYSLYPQTDIPWINNTLIKRSFLLAHQVSWQEDLVRFQDVQFNLHMLLAKPKYEWLNSKVDSYWVQNDGEVSIGKNLAHYDQKLMAITKVYLKSLPIIHKDFPAAYQRITKHIKAFCCYSLFDLKEEEQAENFYQFLKQEQIFHTFDDSLLQMYHRQKSWWVKKAIRLNFKLKLRTALTRGLFLKVACPLNG